MNIERFYEKALRTYFATHSVKPNALEDVALKVYEKWADEPEPELGGKTPREYVASITDERELVDGALESVRQGGEPSPLFLEQIVATPSATDVLLKVLDEGSDEERKVSAQLLSRLNKLPYSDVLEIIFDADTSADLRETLVEMVKYEPIGDLLTERIEGVMGGARLVLAELLVASGAKSEEVYNLLISLLDDEATLPFACNLLGEYGDGRAIEKLIDLSRTCDYADFVELRNAVEMLGGDMPLRFNWDDDKTYKKIKGEN